MKASMIYWKLNNLNEKADEGLDDTFYKAGLHRNITKEKNEAYREGRYHTTAIASDEKPLSTTKYNDGPIC